MKKNCFGKNMTRIMALILCGSMVVSSCLPTVAAKKTKNEDDKIETVYVNATAEGDPAKITVSEQLKHKGNDSLEDYTNLKDIKNVKGDEEFVQGSNGNLIWSGQGNDIFYQGYSDKSLPVSVKVTYYLDGKKISPDQLAGKSGKVKIRFDYSNNQSDTVKVKDKDVKVNTPFTVISAMILPEDNFSNIEVENGKAVSDGDRNIVVGLAMPGLRDSLKLADFDKTSDIDIPDYVEVAADATDFQLDMTATIVTTGTLNDIDVDDIDDLDDIKEDVDKLTDASSELIEGSGKLLDGMNTLATSLKKYTKGVSEVDEGAEKLKDGLEKVANKKDELEDGAEELSNGVRTLKNGTKTINNGIKSYSEGTATLEQGIRSAASGSKALKSGAGKLSNGLEEYTKGATQLQQGLSQIKNQLERIEMPSDSEMKSVSAAASKLEKDAKELQDILDEMVKLLSNLSKVQSALEDGIPALIKASKNAAESQASEKAQTIVNDQAKKAEKAAADAIEKAEQSANDQIDDAAKKASSATKDDIYDKVKALKNDENEEVIEKALKAIEDASTHGSDDKVSLDSNVKIEPGKADIEINISDDKDVKEAISTLNSIKMPDIDPGKMEDLLKDMSTQAKVLEAFGSEISGVADKIPELKSGIKTLSAGANKLTDSNEDLVKGMKQLSKGIDTLNDGLDKLEEGAKKLTASNKTLTGGAQALDEGAGKLLSGTKRMEIAIKKVTAAAILLSKGSIELKEGTGKLAAANGDINTGAGKLVDGMEKLDDGLKKFDEEGIQEIAELAGDDLDTIVTQFKAVKKADENYQSYGGIKEDAKGSVKFIIETAAIEKEE